MTSGQMDEATLKAIDRIEKLMKLAGNNPNPQEAASALARAQELLAAYNLDMAVVEAASGQSGKRTQESISGGGFAWQRRLWRHIAQLNFCMYFTMKVRVKPGSYAEKRKRTFTSEHRLVGRVVNVQQTIAMAEYVRQVIERLRRKRFGSDTKSSDAFAYREGVADAIVDKVVARREEREAKEQADAQAAKDRAAAAGVSLATALTLSTLKERETDANYDHIYGEGASARRRADEAKRRQRIAEAEAAAEKEWVEWSAAHPEEAQKMAAEEAKKERARQKRRARSFGGYGRGRFRETKEEQRRGSDSYYHGLADGETVGIDPQAEESKQRRIANG